MDAKEEALGLLNKIWVKLHNLPNSNPVDLGAFFIILTFMCEFPLPCLRVPDRAGRGELLKTLFCFPVTVLLMAVLTCVTCCCSRRQTKMKDTGI